MYKGKLKKMLKESTGCTIQSDGWTCGSCFFAISEDFENKHWQFILGVRGDYDKKELINYPKTKEEERECFDFITNKCEK